MTDLGHRGISRRLFLGGVAASALAALPAAAQEAPPIEPIGPDETTPEPTPLAPERSATEEPIAPGDAPTGTIEQIAEEEGGEYVAETGHNVSDPFLAIWKQAGAAEGVGRPLSEERFNPDTGAVEQWFEGIVLVNAADPQGAWVTGGRSLGDVTIAAEVPASARQPAASPADDFAAFWSGGGGQAIFGSPRSAPYRKGSATRQAFDSVILERSASGTVSAVAVVPGVVEAEGLSGDAAFLPAPPTLGTSTLVNASDGLRLRSAPSTDAEIVAVLDDHVEFIAVTGATGKWIPGYADGYSGYVAAEYLTAQEDLPTTGVGGEWDTSVWQGVALGETNLRRGPGTDSRIVKTIQYGDPITVTGWVKGQKVDGGSDTWAQMTDGSYVYERNIGRSGPVEPTPVPGDAPTQGKWIDCNLTQQLLIAYEGRTPARVAVQTTGKPGWETPVGYFAINTRVANETMESGSIGADEFYKLENVLYTQYFTDRGHALHFAWWKTPETIGRPGSHGCLNLLLDDAKWFWDWAEIGVPVYCHY